MSVSLLDLPRELRDEIYRLLFLPDTREGFSGPITNQSRFFRLSPTCPLEGKYTFPVALFRTCRRISDEAAPYFYRQRYFSLQAPHQSYHWIKQIGSKNASQIRQLQLVSSFLSTDIDKTGRKIASDAWAAVLLAMGGLEVLHFIHQQDSRDWIDTIYDGSHSKLAEAIRDLSELDALSYSNPRSRTSQTGPVLAITNNKPHLTSLHILGGLRHEPGRSTESYFEGLPKLTKLTITPNQSEISSTLFQSISPLTELTLRGSCYTHALAASIIQVHSKTLQSLTLTLESTSEDDFSTMEASWLLQQTPHLSNLTISDNFLESCVIASLPPKLELAGFAFKDKEPNIIAKNLRLLQTRCPNLRNLILDVSRHRKDHERTVWRSFHEALGALRDAKVYVSSDSCSINNCGMDTSGNFYDKISENHIYQSGLIP
ncbi:MAG: hypothetical protein M1827_007012 [Pycnora praestabilis]|nr:MAG: hypothetical protein M1827_007012 [Pycnora praestabilis]